MESIPANVADDTTVCVVWSEDVDPRATTPLWASVRFIAVDPSTAHHSRHDERASVVIEVSAAPPIG